MSALKVCYIETFQTETRDKQGKMSVKERCLMTGNSPVSSLKFRVLRGSYMVSSPRLQAFHIFRDSNMNSNFWVGAQHCQSQMDLRVR